MEFGRSKRRRRRRRGRGNAQHNPSETTPQGPATGVLPSPRPPQQGQPARAPQPPHQPQRAFEALTSIDPQPRITLEYPGCAPSCRLIDLFCPIGRGQRGLIVSPPKAGKTTLLKDIALAVLRNHPDLELVVLLVDERPEEVTDFRRTLAAYESALASDLAWAAQRTQGLSGADRVAAPTPTPTPTPTAPPDGVIVESRPSSPTPHAPGAMSVGGGRCQVFASSNDHPVEKHIEVSTRTIDHCKQRVMQGKHVVVLLDSLTRLGRAFNNSRRHANSGRIMTGGLDSRALEVPKQIFGSARNTEEAGSLTIIASCLVDTGSAADQIIFEEFKGTGNMELILDRAVAERRLFPAINLAASGTRKENLLLNEQELKTMTALRRRLLAMHAPQQVEQLLAALQRFPTNAALVGSPA
ncbi:MAG: transcription termination factor Rho [Phycisphaeraceae bacterium]|nr:MAG: transcription termination factor Rho [Phycisphaeraceae bacterium]